MACRSCLHLLNPATMAFTFPTVQTLRENLSIKDIVFSSIPTVPTYTGMLNGILPDWMAKSNSVLLIFGLIIFILFLLLLFFFNNEANKKSLAQILATGYFQNFSGKLYFLLTQNNDLTFMFSNNVTHKFNPSQIQVEITLPSSLEDLRNKTAAINKETQIAYIDSNPFNEPFWVRIKQHENGITICEIPRTLFAIPKYLSESYSQQTSIKMHQAFNKKFKQILQDNSNLIPTQKFVVKESAVTGS